MDRSEAAGTGAGGQGDQRIVKPPSIRLWRSSLPGFPERPKPTPAVAHSTSLLAN